jgi:hypothetical protein
LESRWLDVRDFHDRIGIYGTNCHEVTDYPLPKNSYNRFLAISARAVRRSLKEGPRLNAERRGQMDLKFAKWQVGFSRRGLRQAIERHLLTHGSCRMASKAKSNNLGLPMPKQWLLKLNRNRL